VRSQLILSDSAESDRIAREREAICDAILHRMTQRRLGFEFLF
jgi:hypothetical protein